MSRSWINAVKGLVPQFVRDLVRSWRSQRQFRGDFATWAEARAASTGYERENIRQQVVSATSAVRDGRARWERDTVLFDTPEERAELLAVLRATAEIHDGRVAVVDFGGALGSLWWQHRDRWKEFDELQWAVVEQREWVEIGRRDFARDGLTFHHDLTGAVAAVRPSVGVMSGVLAYLEDPYMWLGRMAELPLDWLVLDRVGFCRSARDRLTVQSVPPSIYEASYPCWFLNRTQVLATMGDAWTLHDEWVSEMDGVGLWYEFRGLALRRIVGKESERAR